MVSCLVTLTDLKTRRAGLSASAELLVKVYSPFFVQFYLKIQTVVSMNVQH